MKLIKNKCSSLTVCSNINKSVIKNNIFVKNYTAEMECQVNKFIAKYNHSLWNVNITRQEKTYNQSSFIRSWFHK